MQDNSSPKNLVRITVCAKRNPALSETAFNDHWLHKHGPLITGWLKRHNCVKYVQYRTTSPLKTRLTQRTLEYDGIADFWYKSFEDFERAYEDPFYLDVVKKDEEYLFDFESLAITVGFEKVIIEDGMSVVRETEGLNDE